MRAERNRRRAWMRSGTPLVVDGGRTGGRCRDSSGRAGVVRRKKSPETAATPQSQSGSDGTPQGARKMLRPVKPAVKKMTPEITQSPFGTRIRFIEPTPSQWLLVPGAECWPGKPRTGR